MKSRSVSAALNAFRRALGEETGEDAPWMALQTLAQHIVGARLFTVTTVDMEAELARRLYTNMPDAYPVSGTKPITIDPWFEQVVIGKNLFVANTLEAIAGHFPDWELIGSLGCRSCVNMPVFVGGKVLGTVNMLDAENHFTPERVALVEHLQIPAIAAFLAARERVSDD
ncbi:GAF domain-containing protein [Mesorhizobium sp. CAU 1741]|uniref:GAF domain-containing protein n=1 Tax=Mesorhizobium sp. CAU 1741 TaxID=3140366 RepID=UPI00325B50BB